MSVVPRTRLCKFSSVKSGALPAKLCCVIDKYASNAGSIEMVCKSMPNAVASAAASVREPSLE